jgi:hypothetical protein
MAQRTPGTSGGPAKRPGGRGQGGRADVGKAAVGQARRASTKVQIKKSFPWGFVAGATVLVLVLGGILGYAIFNRGSGFQTAADRLDKTFSGLQVTENPSSNHVATRVDYPNVATEAPDGGNHNGIWQNCAIYTAPIVNEHAVHSLEHGAVWITYRPDLPADQIAVLTQLVEASPGYRMLSPYEGQTSPVALQAWGRRLDVSSATDPRVARFADGYTEGPQTREPGASCSGGVDQPGTTPFVQGPDGTLVPGDATQEVPGEGAVPSGAPGSAAPGAPAPSASP